MQTTGNLGLKKPEGTDIVDIADLNGNMDILDNTVNGKVDKVAGKQLSTNDYTAAEKTKLAGIAAGANNYAHPNHTGDVTSTGDGVTAIAAGVIVNSDINAAAAIDASKIGTGVVSNAEYGYLDGVTSGIQGQLNGKAPLATTPQQTTADITYYVRTDGNDNNTGLANTAGGAFKTIQKAIESLPKTINHNINIYLATGSYSDNVAIKGFHGAGTITLTGNTSNAALSVVSSIDQYENTISVVLESITANTTTKDAFTVNRCIGFRINNCCAVATSSTYNGIITYFSTGSVAFGTYSNKGVGICGTNSSVLVLHGIAGTGNTIGLGVTDGAVVTRTALTLSGAQMESVTGGTITGGVINPWGDNMTKSRSSVAATPNGTTMNVAPLTWTKIVSPYGGEGLDYLNEYDISNGRFTAQKSGIYAFTVVTSFLPPASNVDGQLRMYKNGYSDQIIGRSISAFGGRDIMVAGTIITDMLAGYYIEFYFRHDHSSNLSISNDGNCTYLKAVRVS